MSACKGSFPVVFGHQIKITDLAEQGTKQESRGKNQDIFSCGLDY